MEQKLVSIDKLEPEDLDELEKYWAKRYEEEYLTGKE